MADQERESKALDALTAAAFRLAADRPLTKEEAERFAANPPPLSPEDKKALSSLKPGFVDDLLKRHTTGRGAGRDESAADSQIEQAYVAMHRSGKGGDLSEKARREIDLKRREILGTREPEAKPEKKKKDGS